MAESIYHIFLTFTIFLLFPSSGKAVLPWPNNAETLGTGGNIIDYDINPEPGISLSYFIPFQLTELSIKKLQIYIPVKETRLIAGLGQSGDEIFQETLLTLGTGKKLSEKLYLGVACHYYHLNTINGVNGNTILTEILCLYQPDSHIMFGSYLFNPTGASIENQIRDYRLNQSLHIGCSAFPAKDISLIFEYDKTLGECSMWHFGIDYMLMKAFSLRLGFSGSPFMTSWGIGWKFKKSYISTSANYHPIMGLTSGISIKFLLGRKID